MAQSLACRMDTRDIPGVDCAVPARVPINTLDMCPSMLLAVICAAIGWVYVTCSVHLCGYYAITDIFVSLFMS